MAMLNHPFYRSVKALRYLLLNTDVHSVEVKNTVVGASSCFRL